MQRKVSQHGSDIVYSAADIFMREAHNSQLENAGYTRRSEILLMTHVGKLRTPAKIRIKKGLCRITMRMMRQIRTVRTLNKPIGHRAEYEEIRLRLRSVLTCAVCVTPT